MGNNINEEDFVRLSSIARDNCRVERNRGDFLQLLARCGMSVSQAGYNTVTDLLATSTPALLIPFDGASEKEQAIRSRVLQQKNVVNVLKSAQLNPDRLIAAIASAFSSHFDENKINLDGVNGSVAIIDKFTNRQ